MMRATRYIQLDGGWWKMPGSYVVNEDFPRGIRDVANQITDMGLKFGLHISPLRVNPTDPYWKSIADWLLSPYGKEPIDPNDDDMMTTLGMMYLDGSHPDVPPYLAGQFKQMVEDYKPTFMKWDHHYGSLEEGDRFDPTMTGCGTQQSRPHDSRRVAGGPRRDAQHGVALWRDRVLRGSSDW